MFFVDLDLTLDSTDELQDICAKYNVSSNVLEWVGPAGGWPLIRFIGPSTNVLEQMCQDLGYEADTYVLEQMC